MRVVQATINEEVTVIAVRDCFVTTARAVLMVATRKSAVAVVGVVSIDGDYVFVDMIAVWLVQMTIVDEVKMAIVDYCRMAAARPVDVIVFSMSWVIR